jgi:oligogalacturonide transport system substrate-binding protein
MKKTKAFLCSLSAAALLFTGCSDDSVYTAHKEITEITLSWWGNDARHAYTIEAIERFQELHPEIKVNCSYSEWSGYEARNRVRMASGTESDINQINVGWLKQFSPDGKGYYDIDELSEYVDLSSFPESILEYGKVNGILNAVPIAMNAQTVFINKTVYEEHGLSVPETWDDIFEAAKVLRKDDIYAISAAAKSVWLYAIAYTEQNTGKSILDDEGKLNFNSADLKTMIEFYRKLVKEKAMPQVEYYERLNINTGEYAGTIAWVSDAVNYCGAAQKNGFEMVAADYTADTPDRCGEGWYAKPATLYAVSKHTKHPKEAAMLLDFLLNSKDMAVLQGVEKGIPLSSTARETLDEKGMLSGLQYDASLVMDNNKLIKHMNPILENTDILDEYINACNLVLYNKAPINDAAEELYQKYQKLF